MAEVVVFVFVTKTIKEDLRRGFPITLELKAVTLICRLRIRGLGDTYRTMTRVGTVPRDRTVASLRD